MSVSPGTRGSMRTARSGMKPAELIQACSDAYDSFKPKRTTIDSHIEAWLSEKQIVEDADRMFIQQVVYGCVRFKKLVKVVLSCLYFKHSTEVSREDVNLYMVMSYLTIVRLEDLTIPVWRKFVFCNDHQKMFVFLSFIFNPVTLEKWLKDEWCKFYDERYVEEDLIAMLIRNIPSVSDTIERLRELASTVPEEDTDDGKQKPRIIPQTVVKPFSLTKPKPRAVPEPFAIPVAFTANKVPKGVLEPPEKLQHRVEQARMAAREATTEQYKDPKLHFSFKTKDRGQARLQKLHEKAEEERAAIFDFRAPKANPAPKIDPEKQAKVQLNTAAILREDALIKKKQQKEADLIKNYESGLRDAKDYYDWKAAMEERDNQRRLEEVARRRAEMAMSEHEAKESLARNLLEKKVLVAQMQEQAVHIREKLQVEKTETALSKRTLVEDVKERRAAIPLALEDVRVKKEKAALEKRKEAEAAAAAAAVERAKEQEERMDIVRQIRAMEAVHVERTAHFDPTEPASGVVLLDQMTLAELRERLQLVKRAKEEAVEQKRQEILMAKQEAEEQLARRVEIIARTRLQAANDGVRQRADKLQKEQEAKEAAQKVVHKQMAQLKGGIEKRRKARLAEEAALVEEMRQIKIKRQFLAADASKVEEQRWHELEMAAERILRNKQQDNKTEQEMYQHSRASEKLNKTIVRNATKKKKKEFLADYQARLETSRKEAIQLARLDREEKRKIASTQHSHEKTVKAERRIDQAGRVTYKSMISEDQTDKGRTFADTMRGSRTQSKNGLSRSAVEAKLPPAKG